MWWETNGKENGIESAGLGVWKVNALRGCCMELFLSMRLWEEEMDPWLKGPLTYFAEWRVDMDLNPESCHVLLLAYGQAGQSQSGVYSVSAAVSFSTVREG